MQLKYYFAVLIVILGVLPLFWQIKTPVPAFQYVGTSFDMVDKPFYQNIMEQGRQGNWKVTNFYTTEEGADKSAFLYLFYLSLGHLSRFFQISVDLMFWLYRLLAGLLFVFLIIKFIDALLENKKHRTLAFFFVFFAGGLGYLFPGSVSPDLWEPDFIPLNRFFFYPHFTTANILILGVLYCWWQYLFAHKRNFFYVSILLLILLALVLPYYVIPLLAIISVWVVFFNAKKWRLPEYNKMLVDWRNLFVIVSAVILGMKIAVENTIWDKIQNLFWLGPPPPFWLFMGWGLLIVLAPMGFYYYYRKKPKQAMFFAVWFVVPLVLSFLKISISFQQRRFLDLLLYIPLSVFVSYLFLTFYYWLTRINKGNAKVIFALVFALFFPFFLLNIYGTLSYYQLTFKRLDFRGYLLPVDNISAMVWLKENTPEKSIILSGFYNGEYIPVYAYRKVYLGHAPATLDFRKKDYENDLFFSGQNGNPKKYLQDRQIDYVFYSLEEKRPFVFNTTWGTGTINAEEKKFSKYFKKLPVEIYLIEAYSDFLTPVYVNNSVIIFKTNF